MNTIFESLVIAARCSLLWRPLECLRGKSEDTIFRATEETVRDSALSIPYAPVQDGYFHNMTASESVRQGRIAAVPMIIGASCGHVGFW
jgi:carboxylesterase type B